MDWVQTIAIAAIWFWAGKEFGELKSRKSNAHKFAARLISDLASLQATMRFVGSNPHITAATTSQWEAGKLGKFKVTLEPVGPVERNDSAGLGW